jgi:DNA-binding NarL/FixJ family response regulator
VIPDPRGYVRTVGVTIAAPERARDSVVRLVHRDLGVPALAHAVTAAMGRAVAFDGMCLLTFDPATLLPTAEITVDGLPAAVLPRLNEIELREPDVNKFTALARGPQPAASLGVATGGDLDRSTRQRELRRPSGFADELRVVCRDETGTWGALTLLRAWGRPLFTPADVRFTASLAGILAEGLRRATMFAAARDAGGAQARGAGGGAQARGAAGGVAGDGAAGAGVLVLSADDGVEMANRAADHLLGELGADGPSGLPLVVMSVAARARAVAAGATGLARARVRTPAGRWLVVSGSLLGTGVDARVAVLLDPARPPELAPLIADAYGFTDRERSVTELVARGLSTNEIAGQLHVSAYTVQDHLKSVFEKSGTGSRGDLVARLFFDHYAPRLSG